MSKLNLIITMLIIGVANFCEAQNVTRYIQLQVKDRQSYSIRNFSKLKFKYGHTDTYNSKVYLINDTQFLLINGFNEVGTDTFHIQRISALKAKIKRPNSTLNNVGVIILAVVLYPIGIPILVYNFVILPNRKHWVGKSNFTISIHKNP